MGESCPDIQQNAVPYLKEKPVQDIIRQVSEIMF